MDYLDSPTFERDVLMQDRRSILDNIAEKKERLRKLDMEIIDKVYLRTLLVKEIGEVARPLVNIQRILGTTADVLFKAFNDKHFESDVVKQVVANVRRIFFDDTDPISQTFDCVDINAQNYDNSIRFTFSNGKDLEFNVYFPCNLYEEKYQIDNEEVGGKILVSWMRIKDFEDIIVASHDMDKIAASIKSFMHGYLKPKKIENAHLEQYSFFNKFNEATNIFHTYDKVGIFSYTDNDQY